MFPFTGLLDLLCPPLCSVCGEVLEDSNRKESSFCPVCVQKIVTPEGQFCRRCGGRRVILAGNPFAKEPDECVRCRTVNFRFKRAIALGEYANDLRQLVLRMKTDRTGILAISAAKTLAVHRRTDLENVQADYILPVPMHRFRREERGVNSPDLLAEELGWQLKIPFARQIVQRIRQTDLQYTLSRTARRTNVSGAFAVQPEKFWAKFGLRRFQTSLTGKTVLLIDDILTTGSTCNEIAKILLAAGVRSVTVAVLARAEGALYRQSSG